MTIVVTAVVGIEVIVVVITTSAQTTVAMTSIVASAITSIVIDHSQPGACQVIPPDQVGPFAAYSR